MTRDLVKYDHLPDYSVTFDAEADTVTFINRGSMYPVVEDHGWSGQLDGETYHDARRVAPGWDVREIERAWRLWLSDHEIEPKYPDKHFIKFCRSWYEKRGAP
jgi:hypothetical protein